MEWVQRRGRNRSGKTLQALHTLHSRV